MPQVLINTGWNRIGDWVLDQVRDRLDTPQRRKDGLGGFKRNSYRLNDTGSLSNSLGMEVLEMDNGNISLQLTYPNQGVNAIKGKIFLETGRRPGKGVPVDTQAPERSGLYDWAARKLPGFLTLSKKEQVFRLIRISMRIKQRGMGTFPVFDPSFTALLGQEYVKWWNTLTDEQIEQLPAVEEVFALFRNIGISDEETIEIFR
jgi:hypothetical protein